MLVNLKEILQIAQKENCAIGMFNATGFDSLQAVIGAAEELNRPVIIAHAEVHNVYNDISMVGPAMIAAAKVFHAGAKRCTEFHRELCKTYEDMAKLCAEDTKDMEYTKTVVDRKLREILGDSVQPWDERYSL